MSIFDRVYKIYREILGDLVCILAGMAEIVLFILAPLWIGLYLLLKRKKRKDGEDND